jgi:glycerate dehydrogenase
MKAVFLDCASLDKNDLDFQALHAVFDELILYPSTDAETLVARVQDADVIISNKVMLDADTLKQCPQLKLILISATGTNNIDLQQAKAQGVVVCNCQGYGTAAVAQHTLMLMLNLATSCLQYDRAVQQGEWNKASQFCLLDYPIIELSGKTLGILGYGNWGRRWLNSLKHLACGFWWAICQTVHMLTQHEWALMTCWRNQILSVCIVH